MTALAFAPNGVKKPLLSNVIDEWFGNDFINLNDRKNPACNILNRSDNYLIELAVPGCDKADFKILVDGDSLMISTLQDETGSKKKGTSKMNHFTNYFQRSFALGDNIDINNISAICKNGVLSIVLPILEDKKNESLKIIDIL